MRGKTVISHAEPAVSVASIHFPLAREDAAGIFFLCRIIHASIHFPLAREDIPGIRPASAITRFNPLPSCEGRRHRPVLIIPGCQLQSTSLLRGKTPPILQPKNQIWSFNPLPSCEGRPVPYCIRDDLFSLQSTSLLRGKTKQHQHRRIVKNASIHFPLAREDSYELKNIYDDLSFNPLPSCEGRLPISNIHIILRCFNPLPSCEGRPLPWAQKNKRSQLQSTSLLRGKTIISIFFHCLIALQSTSLLRGKTMTGNPGAMFLLLQSTSLLRGKTRTRCKASAHGKLQSTSLLRGKTANFTKKHLSSFYVLVYFHHTISYYFYSRYEFRCHLFIISSF